MRPKCAIKTRHGDIPVAEEQLKQTTEVTKEYEGEQVPAGTGDSSPALKSCPDTNLMRVLHPIRLLLAILFIASFTATATAGTQDNVYSVGLATRNIYLVNANGTVTNLFTNYTGTSSAAMAVRASDGIVFFITQVANGAVFTWNPATPATAPVQIGTTGAAIPYIPRLAFSASGVLYAVDTDTTNLYTINQATGAATSVGALSGVPTGLGGDIGFAPDGTLYMVAGTTIYTVPLGGGACTSLGTISGLSGGATAIVGMTFDASGRMLVEDDQNPAQLYSVALPSRVATAFTGTMTTSQGDLASAPRVQISGKVFEDVNYGGGTGRSFASSGGVGRPNARVELYDTAGNFITSTVTDASGNYTLSGAAGQTYTIRVVNSSVTSSRPGSVGTLIGVQTFRTSNLTGTTGTADTNRVGGEDPTKIDAGNGSTTLAALTTGTATPQSIDSITLGTSSVTGIDFGFNFDTIVNIANSGQGSLRQFITNSNTLTNAGLAQVGQTAGAEASIFMISNGTAVPGLRAGLTNQLTGGVAQIVVTSQLPAITDANTAIDGTLQTTNVGATNPGSSGTGGTVGVGALSLSTVNKPEVQLSAAQGTIGLGLQIQANSTTVRGLAIYGFGTAANTNGSANIEIENGFTGALIQQNVLGTTATTFADPGAATRSVGDNMRSVGGKTGTISNNLIGFAQGKGIALESTSTGWSIQNNEIRNNGINNPGFGGVNIGTGSTATIQGNLVVASLGPGIDSSASSGSNNIVNNTVTGNGTGSGGSLVDPGIRIFGSSNIVDRNIINANVGAGVLVTSAASTTVITKNSIFANGTVGSVTHEIGIDLLSATDNASLGTLPFVTLNDSGDADTGGNGLLNFPILQTATISNGQLTLTGFARPGSVIELFIASPDPSGFGQGKTYLTSLTEGSGADLDATTGTYGPGAINGIAQGTDTTNRFKFVIAVPSGVSIGTVLTSTATLAGATSEFSGNVTVALSTDISGKVYVDTNHNGTVDSGEDWTSGTPVFVNLVSGGVVVQSVSVPAGTGSYIFNNVTSGNYSIVVTNNATATTAVVPSGFAFVNPTNGTLQINASNGSITNQNFGLFHGSLVSGTVFKDNGASGGTANNGILDGGEQGIPGVTVRATNGGATTYDTEQTASDGTYTLFITPGATTVAIIETNLANYISTGASVGTTSGAYNRATDTTTFTKAGEGIFTGVNFGDVPQNTFQNNGAQQGLPGNVLFYAHTFAPGTAGQVTFSLASTPAPSNVSFGHILYQDINCNGLLDAGEPAITGPVTTVAGTNLCIIMKVTIPQGAPFNATDNTAITASFAYTNANPALSASYILNDLTTVGTGTNAGLRLEKTVDKATALPGANLTYTATFTNDSASPISNLKINDSTPAYTTFVSAACGSPLPNNLTGCSITAPSVGQTGAIQWTFTGTLSPSQTGTVSFVVKIQ
ncbi:MAG TPA: SdrD B-like domain-containing protein [Candidatus Angelobacter sp.]|nr:SdrD B-like domain-containing protein [Candidatus Angelobacter sp.]